MMVSAEHLVIISDEAHTASICLLGVGGPRRRWSKRPLAGTLGTGKSSVFAGWLFRTARSALSLADFRKNSFAAGLGDRLQMYDLSITRTDHSGRMAGECNRPV